MASFSSSVKTYLNLDEGLALSEMARSKNAPDRIFVTYSGGSRVLDDFSGVHLVGEDLVELVDEFAVVDESRLILGLVSSDQLGGLRLGQIYSKGSNASAELK